jgi:F420-dependent oxidoreductase-like protein
MTKSMKLGFMVGYWGAGMPVGTPELILEAERLGYETVWTAEAYGSDALTPLAWWGAQTSRIQLGTSIIQMSARTPTATAMAAITMDHLSGGRFVLGLGASGPQVVEGWYGQNYAKPLERTREYIDIIRRILAREERLEFDGNQFKLPYPGGTGLGKPVRSITHPLREDLPIYLAAESATFFAVEAVDPGRAGRSRTSRSRPRCRSSSTTTSRRPRRSSGPCWRCTSVAWGPRT